MNKEQAIKKIEELKRYVSQCDEKTNKIAEIYLRGRWVSTTTITSVEKRELEGKPLDNVYIDHFKSEGKLYCYLGLIYQVREQ